MPEQPCSFIVLVPDTQAAQYDAVAVSGVLPQPGMWWWATHYARPATDEEATAQARQRLSLMLAGLAGIGVVAEGDLGSSSPLEAMAKVLADHQFDEMSRLRMAVIAFADSQAGAHASLGPFDCAPPGRTWHILRPVARGTGRA
jgi:hypothetical protein